MNDPEFVKSLIGLLGVPVILGLVQMLKPFIKDIRLYAPIGVFMGIFINLIAGWALGSMTPLNWVAAGFQGVIAGLAASGLYSTGQTAQGSIVITKEEVKAVTNLIEENTELKKEAINVS